MSIIADSNVSIRAPRPVLAPPGRLLYLDGLRGLAVLFIVLEHIFLSTLAPIPHLGWRGMVRDVLNWISNGRASVTFFVVLSGYLLMGPVLAKGQLPGGAKRYFRHRAARLLPAYYAAFISSLVLMRLVTPLQSPISFEWQEALPARGLGVILTHLLLIDNCSFHWATRINPPIWTVATLAQIYVLFPLLLLPIWRRIGMAGTVIVAFMLGLGIFLATGVGHAASPWFLSLFAVGMAAAARAQPEKRRTNDAKLFGFLAAVLLVGYAIVTLDFSLGGMRFLTPGGYGWTFINVHWFFDTWIALTSACLLIACARLGRHWFLNCLSSRALVNVGAISYSLFLIHDPLLAVMKIGLNRANLGPFEQFGVYLIVGVPILLLVGHLFHFYFEKPFTYSVAADFRD